MALFAISHTLPTTTTLIIEAANETAAIAIAQEFLPGSRYIMARLVKTFATIEEAHDDFGAAMAHEDYKDNYRAAFEDDVVAYAAYNEQADSGCCGSADVRYMVMGRTYWIGCNYGH